MKIDMGATSGLDLGSLQRSFTGLCAEIMSARDTDVHFLDGSLRNEQDKLLQEGPTLKKFDLDGSSGGGGDWELTGMWNDPFRGDINVFGLLWKMYIQVIEWNVILIYS